MDIAVQYIAIMICTIVFMFLLCFYFSYFNLSNTSSTKIKIKDLNIIFLKMASCPYCIKMEAFLLSEDLLDDFKTIDVKSQLGRDLANKYNCSGFPSFVSLKTNKKTSGYTTNIDQLIKDLE